MNRILKISVLALIILSVFSVNGIAQQKAKTTTKQVEVKNVIFLIGDGMGVEHFSATIIDQNYVPLAMERAQYVGLCKTYSANRKITDSAAAGTALATGTKTNNGVIGLDVDKNPLKSILEIADQNGLATGIVVTCSVTGATPAVFVAHREHRSQYEGIAEDFVKSDIDLFFGGGMAHFANRSDGRNLVDELKGKGFTVADNMDAIKDFSKGRVAALLADNDMPKAADGRGNYLEEATVKALEVLKNNSAKGFFLMVEGSQIDYGGHDNSAATVFSETRDFDKAVKVAFDFADRNPGTLVVVTADHETGGMTIVGTKGDNQVDYAFSTKGHSGGFVPIFAYGTGADQFSLVLENTDLPKIMERLLKLKR